MPRALLLLLMLLVSPALAAAAPAPVAVTPDAIARDEGLSLENGWLYHPGDDPAWADPALDDSTWEAIASTVMPPAKRPAAGWPGIGWFRLHLVVDPALAGTPLALRLSHNGASEVYVDGRLAYTFGRVSASGDEERTYDPNRLPLPVVFDGAGEHVLAVRYSCTASADGATSLGRFLVGGGIRSGFGAALGDPKLMATEHVAAMTATAVVVTLFIGILSAFGLLHLFLFLSYRPQRANLYYSLFAFSFALNSIINFALNLTHLGYEPTALLAAVKPAFVAAIFLFFIAFLYSAFSLPVPKYFWGIVALWLVAIVALTVVPARFNPGLLLSASIFVSISESILNVVRAFRRKLEGVWIINAGVQCYAGALTAELVQQFFGFQNNWLQLVTVAGFLSLPAFVSLYLARAFARTRRDLETKLVEVETLSAEAIEHERREAHLQAENDRRSQELEEARQLQLSMLPASVPVLPGLEIAAYMKPATEVGGDYYDFHVDGDGALTIAVGDATGHGVRAGTMVAATKSLFNVLAGDEDLVGTLRKISLALRDMKNAPATPSTITAMTMPIIHLRFTRARLRCVATVAIVLRSSRSSVARSSHSIVGSTRISNRRLHYLALYLSASPQSSSRLSLPPTFDVVLRKN